jgi:hypothetical protein
MIRVLVLAVVLLVAFDLLYSQTDAPLSNQYSPDAIPYGPILGVQDDAFLTGKPFYAEINARKVEQRPDGKPIVYEAHGALARDSEGRIHREQFPSPVVVRSDGRRAGAISAVIVFDPVAGIELRWGARKTTVARASLFRSVGDRASDVLDACEHDAGKTRYQRGETQVIESLGERIIQGIKVQGCRVTTFIPAGTIRNDHDSTVTDDSWTSYEMHLTIVKTHHDPTISEDEILELDNIERAEPDPALFQAPPGYGDTL